MNYDIVKYIIHIIGIAVVGAGAYLVITTKGTVWLSFIVFGSLIIAVMSFLELIAGLPSLMVKNSTERDFVPENRIRRMIAVLAVLLLVIALIGSFVFDINNKQAQTISTDKMNFTIGTSTENEIGITYQSGPALNITDLQMLVEDNVCRKLII